MVLCCVFIMFGNQLCEIWWIKCSNITLCCVSHILMWFFCIMYVSLHRPWFFSECKWIHVVINWRKHIQYVSPLSSPRSSPPSTHGVRVHVLCAPPFLRNSGGCGRTPKGSHLENNEQQIWRVSNQKFLLNVWRWVDSPYWLQIHRGA